MKKEVDLNIFPQRCCGKTEIVKENIVMILDRSIMWTRSRVEDPKKLIHHQLNVQELLGKSIDQRKKDFYVSGMGKSDGRSEKRSNGADKIDVVLGNISYKVIIRSYKVIIRIEDAFGTTSLTLFNKEAEQLFGVLLQKILAEMEQVQFLITYYSKSMCILLDM